MSETSPAQHGRAVPHHPGGKILKKCIYTHSIMLKTNLCIYKKTNTKADINEEKKNEQTN